MLRNPFRDGRWLTWLLYDKCTPADGMPSRRSLRWSACHVYQSQADHYWSEGDRPGMVPCVESWLHRVDVTRWFGPPLTLWRTDVQVQVFANGRPVTFGRDLSFGDETAARLDFAAHRDLIRDCLVGESRPASELMRADR